MQHNSFSGGFIGQNLVTLAATSSTNDYLRRELAKSKPVPEGTVIMAVEQFAGKGQQGAVWESEPGQNLTCSILLTPTFLDPTDQFSLTVMVSLAIVDFLTPHIGSHQVAIKWPNDIYVDGRKIGGILIENVVQGRQWKSAIIGIGLNIRQTRFPAQFRDRATSLKMLTGDVSDPVAYLPGLCAEIEKQYVALREGQHEQQAQRYRQLMYQIDEEATYLVDGVPVRGKILGVGPHGRLLVDFGGHIADFGIREIAFTS